VHRLDTETSGVLLVGRTPGAYRALREQFNAQQVDKEYRAVVHGDVGSPGTITTPLAHDRRHPGRMRVVTAQAAESGRPARTAYLPVERFGEYTLLAVRIRTGVMHQIRVHLASLHHPIVGDRRYGSPATPGAPARHLLHASRLAFRHPETGQPIQITSALPEDFRAFLGQVGRNVESQRVKGNRSESDPSTFRLLDR